MELVSIVNQLLSLLTLVGQLIMATLIVLFLIKRNWLLDFLAKHALAFSFTVALFAALGSLFYSEIAGYEPCKLCWFQRILMYPQVILFGVALFKKDNNIFPYGAVLSFLGVLLAGYHYLLQIGVAPSVSCLAVGQSVNCSQRFVMQLGYITFPMMALTAFLLILSFHISRKISSAPKCTPLS